MTTATKRIGIFVIAYNAVNKLDWTLDRIPQEVWDKVEEVFLFDDCSTDSTHDAAVGYKHQRQLNKLTVQWLKPDSRILAVTWQDELVNFSRSFPFHPLNQAGNLRIGALVTPGTTFAADWRKGFARQAFETWSSGGEMWVSKRVLSQRPRADWNWAEGDEKRVSWPDFYEFFSHIESGEVAGGEDGFILISPTEKNRQFLRQQLLGDPGRSASLKILKRRFIKKQIA